MLGYGIIISPTHTACNASRAIGNIIRMHND